ncbi:hypothetical protein D3C77_496560 [compost metagenome]
MVAIGLVPGFAGGNIQRVNGYWKVLVGLGVVAVDLNIQGFAWRFAQVGQGANDAELCFLMIGFGTEDQVNELRASRGMSL